MSNYVEIANRILAERRVREHDRDWALKGHAVELWWRGESLWLVADEEDVALLDEPRGTVYTKAEMEHLVTVTDPEIVAEIHRWKKQFNARVMENSSYNSENTGDNGVAP